MNVSPINNNYYYNRPSFGAIRGAEKLPLEVLKAVADNPEFNKLAKELEKKDKDLFMDYAYCTYNDLLYLSATESKKPYMIIPGSNIVDMCRQIKKFTVSDFYRDIEEQVTRIENNDKDKKTALSKLYIKKTNVDNSVIPETPAVQPKKKNFIQRLLGL